jgi:hypothetical protein
MTDSPQISESIETQYLENGSQSEVRIPGCELANLLSQSLTLYMEAEKAHWHLRLDPAAQSELLESGSSIEIAREVCATSLRLISGISRLQRSLHPSLSADCSALLTAIGEKIVENRELAGERLHDLPKHSRTVVLERPLRARHALHDVSPLSVSPLR